ncbi:hypothetical protein VP01_4311g1 [Puccinia sorghi]|uniref:Uncharacterized protein n=1 Tax=Puccinia sorghi TaxID=27349 RepID=A0A0L6UQ36_9BASI|nr:hypothetical protein VP01_4311g1 [Puccinia sorghi]
MSPFQKKKHKTIKISWHARQFIAISKNCQEIPRNFQALLASYRKLQGIAMHFLLQCQAVSWNFKAMPGSNSLKLPSIAQQFRECQSIPSIFQALPGSARKSLRVATEKEFELCRVINGSTICLFSFCDGLNREEWSLQNVMNFMKQMKFPNLFLIFLKSSFYWWGDVGKPVPCEKPHATSAAWQSCLRTFPVQNFPNQIFISSCPRHTFCHSYFAPRKSMHHFKRLPSFAAFVERHRVWPPSASDNCPRNVEIFTSRSRVVMNNARVSPNFSADWTVEWPEATCLGNAVLCDGEVIVCQITAKGAIFSREKSGNYATVEQYPPICWNFVSIPSHSHTCL